MGKFSVLVLAVILGVCQAENSQDAGSNEGLGWTPGGPFPTPDPTASTIFQPDYFELARANVPDLGVIQGAFSYTSPVLRGRRFYWFGGIPYADPGSYVGPENRFKPSKVWTGPLTDDGSKFLAVNPVRWCPQRELLPTGDLGDMLKTYSNRSKLSKAEIMDTKIDGTEDCLVININTPVSPALLEPGNPDHKLPVIVFIHGGSFDMMFGGVFGGHRFLNHDVVLVTINYRLGVLGSFNLGIDEAPGNAAMYDVVSALKWVKNYISYFGGDPGKVTLTGHSAGSVMATHMLTSPLAIDDDGSKLLHGIIGLSGSSLSLWATSTDPITHHHRIASYAGCDIKQTPLEIRNCMANKSLEVLVEAMGKYSAAERYEGRLGFDGLTPSVQNFKDLTIKKFMEDTPYNVVSQGNQLDIPIMMGTTRHDGTFVMEQTYNDYLKPHNYTEDSIFIRNEFLQVLLGSLGIDDPSGELIHSLAHLYIGEAMNSDDFTPKIPGLIDIHSVFGFKAGAYGLVEMHAKKNPNSYYFSFEHWGMWTVDGDDLPGGVGHIDSIFYLFQAFPLILPKDLDVARRFTKYWTDFATYGNPNGDSKKTLASPFNKYNHAYLVLSDYDRTEYYARDKWVDNSLEIMKGWAPEPDIPIPETTTQTGVVATSSSNPELENSTNTGAYMLSGFNCLIALLIIGITY